MRYEIRYDKKAIINRKEGDERLDWGSRLKRSNSGGGQTNVTNMHIRESKPDTIVNQCPTPQHP
jgi:hypothetical protein